MPFRYLDQLTAADVAFEAWGATIETMMLAAAEATVRVLVPQAESIRPCRRQQLAGTADDLDMLVFGFLEDIVFRKDAEKVVYRVRELRVDRQPDGGWRYQAWAEGESLDPKRHDVGVDVKAVTLHRFAVTRDRQGWRTTVVLDV